MSNIALSNCGTIIAQKTKGLDYIVCLNKILSVGEYTDMSGTPVIVTEQTLIELRDNYNSYLKSEYNKHIALVKESISELDPIQAQKELEITIDDFDGLVNQKDHNVNTVDATIGHVVGEMYIKVSLGKPAIFANLKVKGKENVEKVLDNRLRNLSVGYNSELNKWNEISWVIYGADSDANKILSTNLSNNIFKPQDAPHQQDDITVMNKCLQTIKLLDRKIFIDKNLIALCKLRKITKADSYFIEKELANIDDKFALHSVFRILDDQLPCNLSSEKFIDVPEQIMSDLHNTLKAGANYGIYKH